MTRTTALLVGLLAALIGRPAAARTIILTAEDCDKMAVLSANAPRLSWAAVQFGPGILDSSYQLQLYNYMAVLICFPIDKLPSGQRITKAELTLYAAYIGGESKIHVRRVLADWGLGVCHQYRMTYPNKVAWTQPGGRGGATDRAEKTTAIFQFKEVGEQTVDVTEDVELWYTGATPNRGWILNEEVVGAIYFDSPYTPNSSGAKHWKLQITFEPQ